MTRRAKLATIKKKRGASSVPPEVDHRQRILLAAMDLLANGGRDALTTRAVAEAAHVQPPILYRLFGDKAGLLNAVADYGFSTYMERKRPSSTPKDSVESLQAGWKLHVEFGLAYPELYLLMYADPQPESESRAAERSHQVLRDHMRQVAASGRLRVDEERAARLFHAAACGTVMTLLGMKGKERDLSLSKEACNMALKTIVTDLPITSAPAFTAATTLRAVLTSGKSTDRSVPSPFTEHEQGLLIEWLDRFTRSTPF